MTRGREIQGVINNAPLEVREWLIRFGEHLKSGNIDRIFHGFVQLGVDPPDERCGCDCLWDPVLKWVHQNHRVYNLMIWSMLQGSGYTEEIRRMVEADLLVDGEIAEFGDVVRKDYGRALLDGFLVEVPVWATV